MEAAEQDILLDFVADGLGIPREQARASLLNDAGVLIPEAKAFLLNTHKEKVKTIKDNSNAAGYSTAKKEERSAFEKEIKAKFGFDSDAIGVELIEKLINTKVPSGDNIPEDVVKKHPAFLTLESSIDRKVKDAVKDVNDRFEAEQSRTKRKEQDQFVTKSARTLLDGLKPALPKDAKKAENQLKLFDAEVLRLAYELKVAGKDTNIILLDPTDATKVKRLEDEHGNIVKFEDAVKQIAEDLYELEVADARQSAADPNKKGASTKGKEADQKFDLKRPTTDAEYRKALVEIDNDESLDIKARIAKKAALKKLFRGE